MILIEKNVCHSIKSYEVGQAKKFTDKICY